MHWITLALGHLLKNRKLNNAFTSHRRFSPFFDITISGKKLKCFLNIFSFLKAKNASTVCEEIWKFLKSQILNSKKKKRNKERMDYEEFKTRGNCLGKKRYKVRTDRIQLAS